MLPTSRTSCSLHVLVPHAHPRRPDLHGLVATLADRLDAVTVIAWAPSPADLDLDSVERVADVLDDLEVLSGTRPAYVECHGAPYRAVEGHLARQRLPHRTDVLAIAAGTPSSLVRAIRRAVAAASGHVALLPDLDAPVRRPVGR